MRRLRTNATIAAVGAALVIPVGIPGTAAAAVPAGYDLLETVPGQTYADVSLPMDFFDPGSDPFMARINFGGEPLETFMGHDTGDADTVVQRTMPATPGGAPVPIELVQLNLVSMQPITVTYNGGQMPEMWNVQGVPQETQTQGHIQLRGTEGGGTFNSQLPVNAKLIFTRLSDGRQKEFDAPPLEFQGNNIPWQPGCRGPALHVPGLNDGFCPGLTPQLVKAPFTEQAALAAHGVVPAQPALEHFKCYTLERAKFKARNVTLIDQFGPRKAKVAKRRELCNPVQKNQEPFSNRNAHLQCYATESPLGKQVAVQNQFGSQNLQVTKAIRLCLPTQKRLIPRRGRPGKFRPIEVAIDHFQCYNVAPLSPLYRVGQLNPVRLKDQFGTEKKVKVGDPKWLCAPAQKEQETIQHPVKHLVCYQIQDKDVVRTVEIRNQFERRVVVTRRPVRLCVPSNKVVIQ